MQPRKAWQMGQLTESSVCRTLRPPRPAPSWGLRHSALQQPTVLSPGFASSSEMSAASSDALPPGRAGQGGQGSVTNQAFSSLWDPGARSPSSIMLSQALEVWSPEGGHCCPALSLESLERNSRFLSPYGMQSICGKCLIRTIPFHSHISEGVRQWSLLYRWRWC